MVVEEWIGGNGIGRKLNVRNTDQFQILLKAGSCSAQEALDHDSENEASTLGQKFL